MIKNISKKSKIVFLILLVIIVAGIIITAVTGLNFDLKYRQAQKIEIYLEKEFDTKDIKAITDEVIGNEVVIQKVELYKDMLKITSKEITDEQKQNIITKLNEKYGTELKAENIEIEEVSQMRGRDIIKPYIVPVCIILLLSVIYTITRYREQGKLKVAVITILAPAIVQLLYLSLLAITRLPVNEFTMPVSMLIYLVTLLVMTNIFEKNKQ